MQAFPAEQDTVNHEQDDGPAHGGQKSHGLARFIPAGRTPGVARDPCTRDAEEDGDDDPARVVAGQNELGNDADQ